MKVNLLQGTYTPTLTPMPGVHQLFERTTAQHGQGGTCRGSSSSWQLNSITLGGVFLFRVSC